MNFDFGKVLTRAWQIIWKYKVLWIFGILASCARRGGGGGSGGGNRYQVNPNAQPPLTDQQLNQGMEKVQQFIVSHIWVIVAAIVFLILLSIVLYAVGMMGRIGLIKGTYKAEMGAERLTFAELWNESMPYFWRVFGLNFLLGLAIFVIVVILIVPFAVVTALTAGIGLLCLLPLICLLIPLSWVLLVITEQAQSAIVLEDLGIFDGFRRGWDIAKSNVGVMIIMTLILGIGGAIISVIIAVPVIIAVLPIIIGAGTLRESLTPVWIALGCCAIYFPVLIFLNGILTAYIQSAWTLTFMQLAKPKENTPAVVESNA